MYNLNRNVLKRCIGRIPTTYKCIQGIPPHNSARTHLSVTGLDEDQIGMFGIGVFLLEGIAKCI